MKSSLLLFLFICLKCVVCAQPLIHNHALADNTFTVSNSADIAQKTTSIQHRLIATSYFESGVMVDTERFYYSGARGSYFANCYDNFNIIGFPEFPAPTANFPALVNNIKVDSYIYKQFSGHTMVDSESFFYQYDASDRITKISYYNTDNVGVYSGDNLVTVYKGVHSAIPSLDTAYFYIIP